MAEKQKHLCACGSGKRAKQCCRAIAPAEAHLSQEVKRQMRLEVEALAKAGRHSEASAILEELAAHSPKNPLIWNDLGVQYEAAGEPEKALTALRRGHAIDPSYPPTLFNLGKFTLDRSIRLSEADRQSEEARRLLKEAIKLLNANLDRDAENVDGHTYLAMAYGLADDEHRARAHAQIALKLKQSETAWLPWSKSGGDTGNI